MEVILALDVLGAVVVAVALAIAALAVRRRLLARRGATFDCSLRLRTDGSGKGWTLGLGRYADDHLEWYRVFSYATRPKRVLVRRELEVLDRREPEGAEVFALLAGAVVVRCRSGSGPVELGMSPDAMTGFLSWLESAPPGRAGVN